MHYQKKKLTRTAVAVLMILSAACVSAQAEDAAATKEDTAKTTNTLPPKVVHKLSPITIVEQREQNGERVLSGSELQMLPTSTGTVTDSLRGMSSVQFDPSSRTATTGGEITPPAISIRGSRHWENSFTINGISNNSTFGAGAWNPNQDQWENGEQSITGDAQSIILPVEIIDSVKVLSENVSAQYGDFTGGVVDAKIRDAQMDRWHISANIRHTSDSLTKLHLTPQQEKNDKPTQSDALQKKFKRYSGGFTLDGPLGEGQLGVLMSYQKDWASMKDVWSIQGGKKPDEQKHDQKRNLDNFLLKVHSNESEPFYIAGTLIYSPYTADLYASTVKDGAYSLKGGGLSFMLNTRADLSFGQWTNDFGWSRTEVSRDADSNVQFYQPNHSNWTMEGLTGDLDQVQDQWTLKSGLNFDALQLGLSTHQFNIGIDTQYVKAKTTTEKNKVFRRFMDDNSAQGSRDDGVIAGEQYARDMIVSPQQSAKQDYLTLAGYIEDTINIERLMLRPGVRVSYDNITKDVNLAPRFFVNLDILNDHRFNINGGYNRYYGSQILSYALRGKQESYSFHRDAVTDKWQ